MANAINTRIQLKYDSYTAWEAVKETFKPLKGEICIVNPGTSLSDASTTPCLMKVGDGTHVWKDLPWVSATAADVYSWAKKSWADFQADILPVITAAVTAGKELDETTVNNVKTINHEVKLGKEFAGAATPGKAETAGSSVTIKVPKLEVNTYGHVTAVQDVDYTVAIPATVTPGDGTVTISGEEGMSGGGTFTLNQDTDVTITVKHDNTSDVENVTAQDRTYVKSLTFDDFGHVTAVDVGTETVTNTAHTHVNGKGTTVSHAGGTNEENVAVNLNIKFNEALTDDNMLQLVDVADNTIIAEFDASTFVKDSFLENASYNPDTNTLTLTFVDNADNKEAIEVDLTDLVDVYEADELSLTKNGATFSIKNGGVTTAKIADKAVEYSKLEEAVQTSLNAADTAIQSTIILGKTLNHETTELTVAEAETALGLSKYALKTDLPSIPAISVTDGAPAAATDSLVAVVTGVDPDGAHGIKTTVVSGIATADYVDTQINTAVQDLESKIPANEDLSIYGLKEGSNTSTGTDAAKYLIFNCGTSTTII